MAHFTFPIFLFYILKGTSDLCEAVVEQALQRLNLSYFSSFKVIVKHI